jgi:hypothetical protein
LSEIPRRAEDHEHMWVDLTVTVKSHETVGTEIVVGGHVAFGGMPASMTACPPNWLRGASGIRPERALLAGDRPGPTKVGAHDVETAVG